MEAFELRLWDGRIGRWLSPDPKKQYASPYLGMGNDPINRIDPDGGEDWYKNEDTGEVTWFDGSGEIDGYDHLGYFHSETDIDGNTMFYDGAVQASFYNGNFQQYFGGSLSEMIINVDTRSFGSKALSFGSDMVAPFMELPQDLAFPVINQFNVFLNEGFHEGRANNPSNYVLSNTYQFKNWRFEKGNSITSSGTPNWDEGKEKIMNTLSVSSFPFTVYEPVLNTSSSMINKYAPKLIDEVTQATILYGIQESLNLIHE